MSPPPPDIVRIRPCNTLARVVLVEDLQHVIETQRQDGGRLVDSFPILCGDVPRRTIQVRDLRLMPRQLAK